jgi:small-conductance mechanosensitive channel
MDNRHARKKQLAGIRRRVEQTLANNMHKWTKKRQSNEESDTNYSQNNKIPGPGGAPAEDSKAREGLAFKQAKVHEFEAAAKTLVDAMHVPDLRYCPRR